MNYDSGSPLANARRAAAEEIVEAQLRWIAKLVAANAWPVIGIEAGMAIWADALEHRAAFTRELRERVEVAGAANVFGPIERAATEQVGRQVDELIALYRAGEMGEGLGS